MSDELIRSLKGENEQLKAKIEALEIGFKEFSADDYDAWCGMRLLQLDLEDKNEQLRAQIAELTAEPCWEDNLNISKQNKEIVKLRRALREIVSKAGPFSPFTVIANDALDQDND